MGKFGKKFALEGNTPVVQATNDILEGSQQEPMTDTNGYGLSEVQAEQVVQTGERQQGRVAQPIPKANIQMQQVAQSVTPVPAQVNEVSMPVSVLKGGPLVYNEETKGISVKIPYSLYDALDAIKKQTQRTGNRNDKMGIGDLVVLAVKEFVERNAIHNS